jgi:hypothetical protein
MPVGSCADESRRADDAADALEEAKQQLDDARENWDESLDFLNDNTMADLAAAATYVATCAAVFGTTPVLCRMQGGLRCSRCSDIALRESAHERDTRRQKGARSSGGSVLESQ